MCVCVCVCIYTHLTPYRLYINYRCHQITIQRNSFTQIGAVRSVGWIFIVGAPVWRLLGEYGILGRTFYSILFKREAVAAVRVTAKFYSILL